MNIPFPPTDNLYKFIAIFALAIIILVHLSDYFVRTNIFPKLEKIRTDRVDIQEQMLKMCFDTVSVALQLNKVNKSISNFERDIKTLRKTTISQGHVLSDVTLNQLSRVNDSLFSIHDSLWGDVPELVENRD